MQEAVYNMYEKRKSFNTPLELKAYLFTSVHNEIINIFRKDDRHERYLNNKDWEEENFVNQFILQETLDKLYDAIDRLPEPMRQIFDMSFEQGMKNKEIAEVLQLSPETIKKRKAKLINSLRQEMKDEKTILFLISILSI